MTTFREYEVRRLHQPVNTCSCGKWECSRCGTTWPCDEERALRDSGVPPVGIDGYPVPR